MFGLDIYTLSGDFLMSSGKYYMHANDTFKECIASKYYETFSCYYLIFHYFLSCERTCKWVRTQFLLQKSGYESKYC